MCILFLPSNWRTGTLSKGPAFWQHDLFISLDCRRDGCWARWQRLFIGMYFNFIKSSFHLIFVQYKWAFTYTCAHPWACSCFFLLFFSIFFLFFFSVCPSVCVRFPFCHTIRFERIQFHLFQTNNEEVWENTKKEPYEQVIGFLSKMLTAHRIQFVIYIRNFHETQQ